LAEHAGGVFGAVDELLGERDVAVLLRRQLVRRRQVFRRKHLRQAQRGALVRRLDDQRQLQLARNGLPVALFVEDAETRRRQLVGDPDHLGAPLVHADRRAHHAAAGVGDAEHLERALDGAVLAAAAVQRDEAAREAFALQLEYVALRRIEGVRVDALGAQCLQNTVTAHERDFALRGFSAHQHRDFAVTHAGCPTTRTSVERTTPFIWKTMRWMCFTSHSMSAALPLPSGLTMKLACFSETRAPPRPKPFSPQASIRRAAWSR